MKNVIFIFCLFVFLTSSAQNNFYFGTGIIGTQATTVADDFVEEKKSNFSDFGIYYGNLMVLDSKLKIGTEVFYLNNRVVLGRDGDEVFELHQNLGFKFKLGFFLQKHSFFFSGGMLAVYLFDKDELLGYQLDRFDDSLFYGLEYDYMISDRWSSNIGVLYTKFESISHYTQYTLKDFTTFYLSFNYHLY